MKAAALKGALSDRARNGRVHVVESLVTGDKPSTKAALTALTAVSDRTRFLVVLERGDNLTWLSLRNAARVHIIAVDQLNTYDVLLSDDVVFTKGAFEAFVGGSPKGKSVKAVATSAEAAPAEEEAAKPAKKAAAPKAAKPAKVADVPPAVELPAGAKAPLKSGGAPKGYEIKGNADSGKYHEPDGQWYDATVAEFYFKSAEDAEAAGFTRAGGGSEEDDK
jgi:large subunit ribosomal protein L4